MRPRALRARAAWAMAVGRGTHENAGHGVWAAPAAPLAWAGRARRLELPRLRTEEQGGQGVDGDPTAGSGTAERAARVRARLRVAWASAMRAAAERVGVTRGGAPVQAEASRGQHELEEDHAIDLDAAFPDLACAAQEWAGTTCGARESVRSSGSMEAAGDHLRSSESTTTTDIDVSRARRKFGGLMGRLRARVRAAFGDG